MSSNLIDTTEMYLRTILELQEEGITPLRARIAERIKHSGPTVSQTVSRMERDGLLFVSSDRHLQLTNTGMEKAISVMRKHRLTERLLTDVIGLEIEYVHEEACRWEHVMSDRVEEKLVKLLEVSSKSPWGNPVPGLAELGVETKNTYELDVVDAVTLVLITGKEKISANVAFFAEPIQGDRETIVELKKAGVMPDAEIEITRDGYFFIFNAVGNPNQARLSRALASHIFCIDA